MDTLEWKLALILPLYVLPWLVVFVPSWWLGSSGSRQRQRAQAQRRADRASYAAGHHPSH